MGRAPTEASIRRPMAARRGRRSSSSTTTPGSRTSRSIRRTAASCTRPAISAAAAAAASTAAVRAARSGRRRTPENRGRSCPAISDYRPARGAASRSTCRDRIRESCTCRSKPEKPERRCEPPQRKWARRQRTRPRVPPRLFRRGDGQDRRDGQDRQDSQDRRDKNSRPQRKAEGAEARRSTGATTADRRAVIRRDAAAAVAADVVKRRSLRPGGHRRRWTSSAAASFDRKTAARRGPRRRSAMRGRCTSASCASIRRMTKRFTSPDCRLRNGWTAERRSRRSTTRAATNRRDTSISMPSGSIRRIRST